MKDILDKISVDIVLPNYNSYPFIEETIKSIISQTFKIGNYLQLMEIPMSKLNKF